ncbi:MAG: CHC2 zinc finger domain-containing protein [Nocardioidaceae bacterium]
MTTTRPACGSSSTRSPPSPTSPPAPGRAGWPERRRRLNDRGRPYPRGGHRLVRERARIDEVIEQYVTLRNAGAGSRKGLCPFHDEKSPSFNVTPSRGMYYCFGCGEGGDVFKFLQQIDGIGFTEAVERLAGRYDVQLRYADGPPTTHRDHNQRSRLVRGQQGRGGVLRRAAGQLCRRRRRPPLPRRPRVRP